MDSKPLGIFDSGVGGLTVAREIINLLPNENIIYLGDTARFPYGPRSPEELKSFVFQIIKFLKKEGVKLVVVACNSSAATALEAAQESFDLPILGVIEPGARTATLTSRNRKIGVIGTHATVRSQAYPKIIHTFDAGVKVYAQVCPPFANLVEEGLTDGEKTQKTVKKYLQPLISVGVDTLVLGCTHYPPLSGVIQRVMGEEVKLISSAEETADEVKTVLLWKDQLRKEKKTPFYRFISTGDGNKFLKLGKRFLGSEIGEVEKITLS